MLLRDRQGRFLGEVARQEGEESLPRRPLARLPAFDRLGPLEYPFAVAVKAR